MSDYIIRLNDKKRRASLGDSEVSIDGKSYNYEYEKLFNGRYTLRVDNKFYEVSAERLDKEKFVLVVNGKRFETEAGTLLEEKAREVLEQSSLGVKEKEVKAPMPGMILKILKKSGDAVKSNESVLILEAMKMENELKSSCDGKIREIFVKEGDKVEKGMKLFSTE